MRRGTQRVYAGFSSTALVSWFNMFCQPMPLGRKPEPFDHPEWIYELKYDGFRALAVVEYGRCTLISRNGHPFASFSELASRIGYAPERRKVISIGADAELLWLRHAVLQTAGFHVLTTENETDALASIRRGECGVLLVCYSLSFGLRQRLAKTFRSHCPHGKILAITNIQLDKPDFADDFVYGVEGPEVLIQSIHNA